jgi:hypothetical protein
VLTSVLAVFSARFLAVPAVAGAGALLMHRILAARRSGIANDDPVALDADDRGPRDLVVLPPADAEPVEPARAANAERGHLEARPAELAAQVMAAAERKPRLRLDRAADE